MGNNTQQLSLGACEPRTLGFMVDVLNHWATTDPTIELTNKKNTKV